MTPDAKDLARIAFGTSLVPPGRATRAFTWLRARLLGVHRVAGPPPVRIMEGLFGLIDNRVLGVLVELDVPEHLDGPRSADELAIATGTDRDRLARVLRYAASRGFLDEDRKGRFRPNPVTRRLGRGHPNSWRGWVEFGGSDWFWEAWRHLPSALEPDGPSGFEAAKGQPFFEYVNHVDPGAGRVFNAAMEAGSTVQGVALAAALDWDRVASVCDVGGGTGAVLEAVLASAPHVEGVLFDLPEVVVEARSSLSDGALAGRCRTEGGSFFEEVPAGADRYLLLAVVHDWSDDEAVAILSRVREAMSPGSDVVIVEWELPERATDDFAFAADVLMLAVASGRERTHGEFVDLFDRAGLRLEQRVWLATGAAAFVLTAR